MIKVNYLLREGNSIPQVGEKLHGLLCLKCCIAELLLGAVVIFQTMISVGNKFMVAETLQTYNTTENSILVV